MRGLFICVVVFLGYNLLIGGSKGNEAENSGSPILSPVKIEDGAVRELDGGNYRAKQLDSLEMYKLLDSLKNSIKVVIRLNADGEDVLTMDSEAQICDQLGIRFYYFNIEGNISENIKSSIFPFLSDGGVLVHCLHGFDRVGAVSGLWLKSLGWRYPSIIEYNEWGDYIERKGEDYRKYINVLKDPV